MYGRNQIIPFFCGIAIGLILSFLIRGKQTLLIQRNSQYPPFADNDIVRYGLRQKYHAHKDVTNVTKWPFEEVRVLCWVMTTPNNFKKAIHVRDTWLKRCNIWLFMSSEENKDLPAVGLEVQEGRINLYQKTIAAHQYLLKNYINECDWFLKADDDTYVIMENLRFLLKDYNPEDPIYFGKRFKTYVKQGYMSGGAGYVLSKEAVKRFVQGVEKKTCKQDTNFEDVEIGRCLETVGVMAMDSRDSENKETFFPIKPEHTLVSGLYGFTKEYYEMNFYPTCLGRPECLSKYPISFHQFDVILMHSFDYMLYRARVRGVSQSYSNCTTLDKQEANKNEVPGGAPPEPA